MTNRERINNMSNEDMGVKIFTAITKIQNEHLNHNSFEICDRFIAWLSQEVEEDYVYIPNIGKIPKTDKTKTTLKYSPFEIEQNKAQLRSELEESDIYDKEQDCIKIPINKLYTFVYDVSTKSIVCMLKQDRGT